MPGLRQLSKPLEGEHLDHVLRAVDGVGPLGQDAVAYLRQHRVSLGFTTQRNSGARWYDWRTLRRGVFLNAAYRSGRLGTPQLAALLVHEVVHLRQGIVEALSVRGELVAWQVQVDIVDRLGGSLNDARWRQLQRLDPRSHDDLRSARGLIKQIGGPGYHIELLPLIPPGERLRRMVRHLLRAILRRFAARGPTDSAEPKQDKVL